MVYMGICKFLCLFPVTHLVQKVVLGGSVLLMKVTQNVVMVVPVWFIGGGGGQRLHDLLLFLGGVG